MVAMVAAVQSSYDKRSFTWSHKGRERFQMIVTPVDGRNATTWEMTSFLFFGISKMYQRKGNTVPLRLPMPLKIDHALSSTTCIKELKPQCCQFLSRRVLTQWQIHVWRTNILKLFLILDNFGMSWPLPWLQIDGARPPSIPVWLSSYFILPTKIFKSIDSPRNRFTISLRVCILIINTREIPTEPDRTRIWNVDSTTLLH